MLHELHRFEMRSSRWDEWTAPSCLASWPWLGLPAQLRVFALLKKPSPETAILAVVADEVAVGVDGDNSAGRCI